MNLKILFLMTFLSVQLGAQGLSPDALPPDMLPPTPTEEVAPPPPSSGMQMPSTNPALTGQTPNAPVIQPAAPLAPPLLPAKTEASSMPIQADSEEALGNKSDPTATVHTNMGTFTIRLFLRDAPKTVLNFIELAKGEKEFVDVKNSKKVMRPFYNGLIFHRVTKNFIIQTGCPFGNGRGGPGFTIPDEIVPYLKHDRPGMISMANARSEKGDLEPNSSGSQFFITLGPQPVLDGKFTIFGQIIKGMSVVEKISAVPVGPTERPTKRVIIRSIDIQGKYKFF